MKATLFLFGVEDINLLRESIPTVKKDTNNLSVASPEFSTEIYRKLSTMFATRENTWKNHNIKRVNKSSERKAKIQIFGTDTNE